MGIGYIFVKLQNLAFFISGAIGGGFLGLFLYELFLTKLNSDYTTVIMWGTIIIVALICGVIAHKLRDTVLIVVTAFVGSYLAVRAVSLIVGGFPPESAIAEYIKYGAWDDLTQDFWMYCAAMLVLGIIGVAVQCHYKKDEEHSGTIGTTRKETINITSLITEESQASLPVKLCCFYLVYHLS